MKEFTPMRSKIVSLILGCGMLAAAAVPSLACSYNSQASTDNQPQQTAQAQTSQTATQ